MVTRKIQSCICFQKPFYFSNLLNVRIFSSLAPVYGFCDLNGIHSQARRPQGRAVSVPSQTMPTLCEPGEWKCKALTEGLQCFWDQQAISSDRDEEGKSSLPFTNMDNYTERKAVERLGKFSRSLGSLPNFGGFIQNEPLPFFSSSSANKKKSIAVIILKSPPRKKPSERTNLEPYLSLENWI